MAVHGPDSGYAWIIVVCCSFIHFAFFGLFRSSGVIYVAMLQDYKVSREEASWPFALCAAVFQLSGPSASILTHYMSQRKACLLGSAIATFGIAACYFAENVMWINIFYGIVHGIGFGFVITLIPVALNQYFVKHRATAIGLAFAGGTMSSLIFPLVMEWLLEKYSLRECFLLLSGVVMNTLVASALLRVPPWIKNSKNDDVIFLKEGSEANDSGVSTSPEGTSEIKEATIPTIYKLDDYQCDEAYRESSISRDSSGTDKTLYEISEITNDSQEDLEEPNAKDCLMDKRNSDTICSNNDSVLFDGSNSQSHVVSNSESIKLNRKSENFAKADPDVKEPLIGGIKMYITPKKTVEEIKEKHMPVHSENSIRHSILEILKQPVFHLITFTMCIYFLGVHSFFMVIVDFAKDKGIPEPKGIYIISMFSLTDMFGRAGLGWVTDRNFISRRTMIGLNLGALGILYQLYPLIDSLSGILVVAAFCGLSVGSSITLFFVLQAECLGMKKLTLVVGLTSFINGLMSLLRPGIIGLFRDVIGSYNWMFHCLGVNFLIFSIIWLIESWKKRDGKSPNRIQNEKV